MSPSGRANYGFMVGPGLRKQYPKGPKKQLTTAWKVAVRARLAALGRDHRWLEQQIRAGRGMVTRMLSDGQNTSALVDQVCSALEIPPPMAVLGTADEIALVEGFRRLPSDKRDYVLGLLGMLDPGKGS